jgi:hypothetical protein
MLVIKIVKYLAYSSGKFHFLYDILLTNAPFTMVIFVITFSLLIDQFTATVAVTGSYIIVHDYNGEHS